MLRFDREAVLSTSAHIDFWFDFISPYGYLASLRVDSVAERHGRKVDWHCMLLGVSVLKVMGLKPLMETPLKRDYVPKEVHRYARRHGIELNRDLFAPPMNPLPVARVFCWLKEHRPTQAKAFAREAMKRYWVDVADLSDGARLSEALQSAGLEAGVLESALKGDGPALLRAEVERATQLGVFGSPFFLVDAEPFFGVDKLEVLDEWLQRGGW